jgi:hypothetical protein
MAAKRGKATAVCTNGRTVAANANVLAHIKIIGGQQSSSYSFQFPVMDEIETHIPIGPGQILKIVEEGRWLAR